MNKKAISPLIATVLIIGFTVALAAVIITWGTRFTLQTTESVDIQANLGLACARLNYDITNVTCTPSGTPPSVSVTLKSNNDQEIKEVILRVTGMRDISGTPTQFIETDDIGSNLPTGGLPGFGSQIATFAATAAFNSATLVEVIPEIELTGTGTGVQPCSAALQSYVPTDTTCT